MGRNDIRLRRSKISSRRIDRYRNYGELMSRHAQNQKIKRLTKVFVYFMLILFLGIILFLVFRWEKKQDVEKSTTATEISILHSTTKINTM
jgi:cell division protein FtsL